MDPQPGRIDALDPQEEADLESDEVEVVRIEIEQTRAEMGETIEAIKERLNPQLLMQQAKETVREATVGKVQDMASTVVESARETAGNVAEGAGRVIDRASTTAREAGSSLIETIQRNPMPSAMICFGLSWLWINRWRGNGHSYWRDNRSRDENYPWSEYQPPFRSGEAAARGHLSTAASRVGETFDQAKERVGETFDQAKERVGAATDQVQQRVSQMGQVVQHETAQATDWLQQWMEQNPLAAGAVALALGAAAGMAVPETPQEQRWLGRARDRVVDKAQQTAQEVGQKVQAVAQEAMDTVREQARSQGLTG